MKSGLIVAVVLVCTGCSAEPHQKSFAGDRFQRDSGYWTRYNNQYAEDFWVSSTPDKITFHLTNISKTPRTKPIFSKDNLAYFIDVEYKGVTVSQLEPHYNRPTGSGGTSSDTSSNEWVLPPEHTASGTFDQEKIAQRYWSDTFLRPVLWREEAVVRFNFNGIVSNSCVVRKKPGAVFVEKWEPKSPAPIYFDCSKPGTQSQRLKDNKKRIPLTKRWDKNLISYEYHWAQ